MRPSTKKSIVAEGVTIPLISTALGVLAPLQLPQGEFVGRQKDWALTTRSPSRRSLLRTHTLQNVIENGNTLNYGRALQRFAPSENSGVLPSALWSEWSDATQKPLQLTILLKPSQNTCPRDGRRLRLFEAHPLRRTHLSRLFLVAENLAAKDLLRRRLRRSGLLNHRLLHHSGLSGRGRRTRRLSLALLRGD